MCGISLASPDLMAQVYTCSNGKVLYFTTHVFHHSCISPLMYFTTHVSYHSCILPKIVLKYMSSISGGINNKTN